MKWDGIEGFGGVGRILLLKEEGGIDNGIYDMHARTHGREGDGGVGKGCYRSLYCCVCWFGCLA